MRQQQRRQQRFDRYERVVELYNQGYSQRAIGNELGIGRKTVRRWLLSGQFPERKPPQRKPARVTEFADYLQCRWNEGCHNATRLYEEIRHKGYTGKRSMVAKFVSSWRHTGKPNAP
jgi:transposase